MMEGRRRWGKVKGDGGRKEMMIGGRSRWEKAKGDGGRKEKMGI